MACNCKFPHKDCSCEKNDERTNLFMDIHLPKSYIQKYMDIHKQLGFETDSETFRYLLNYYIDARGPSLRDKIACIFRMSKSNFDRLMNLTKKNECSKADIVAQALQLYEAVLDHKINGEDVFVHMKDGTQKKIF